MEESCAPIDSSSQQEETKEDVSSRNEKVSDERQATIKEEKEHVEEEAASLPVYDESEIQCGSTLGSGATSTVYAVECIKLNNNNNNSNSRINLANKFLLPTNVQYNDFVENSKPSLALKLPKKVLQGYGLRRALQDLQTEITILTKLQYQHNSLSQQKTTTTAHHANIIRLHGIVTTTTHKESLTTQSLLIDKLNGGTLTNYINKWREDRGVGLCEYWNVTPNATKELWLERLMVVAKIASALEFLHKRRIIYRDLKPDNVGFRVLTSGVGGGTDSSTGGGGRNVVVHGMAEPVLFDFGLARTLPASSTTGNTKKENNNNANFHDKKKTTTMLDEVYEMSGDTGSKRYMAPEVYQEHPYNLSADIYSLSILMYEILTLRKPYGSASSKFYSEVVLGGKRPPLNGYCARWPVALIGLMESMWDQDLCKRPKCDLVVMALEGMLRGPDVGLYPR